MTITFHPHAIAEAEFAAKYYESQESGLGNRFSTSIDQAMDSIEDSPQMWPLVEHAIRRRMIRDFPFQILYRILDHHILIVAVMHTSREPGYWKDRFE